MRVSQSCYAVTGLGFIPPWIVNAGFIVGEEKTLIIDTGANWTGAQTIAGYAMVIKPHNQRLVFNTEPHFDHISGNSFFHDLEIDIYGHPDIQRTAEEFHEQKFEFNQTIIDPARNAAAEESAFFVNTRLANPNKPAGAGHTFDLGGVTAKVVALPGHTPINQGIYCPDEKVLFCADCIVTDYIPNLEVGNPDLWREWLKSLDKIDAMSPNTIVPGHGRVIRREEISEEINRMSEFLHKAIQTGKAPTGNNQ